MSEEKQVSETPYSSMPPMPQEPGGVPPGIELATWGTRFLGGLVDYVAPAIIFNALVGFNSNSWVPTYLQFAWWIVLGVMVGTSGQTPGKRMDRVKVLRERDGQVVGVGIGILRQFAHIIDSLACLLGWLWPLWDRKRQTFADKIVSTVAIKI
jgi:uncharacterized RDD family membrane protein YckC